MPDLSREQLAHHAAVMRDFMGTEAYAVWVNYLQRMVVDVTTKLVTGSVEDFLERKGIIEGLKMAEQVPDNIVAWEKNAKQSPA